MERAGSLRKALNEGWHSTIHCETAGRNIPKEKTLVAVLALSNCLIHALIPLELGA
jgi:hypothetical protein